MLPFISKVDIVFYLALQWKMNPQSPTYIDVSKGKQGKNVTLLTDYVLSVNAMNLCLYIVHCIVAHDITLLISSFCSNSLASTKLSSCAMLSFLW